MKLFEYFDLKRVTPYLTGETKEEILNELISQLYGDCRISDIEAVRTSVFERESLMSTNLGNGFAIPHGKCNAIDGMVAVFGRTKTPIRYSEDDAPVQNFFLLVSNSNLAQKHIKILSRLALMMSSEFSLDALVNSPSEDAFYSLFQNQSSGSQYMAMTA